MCFYQSRINFRGMRKYKTTTFLLVFGITICFFSSCGNSNDSMAKFIEERDSIMRVSQEQEKELNELNTIVTTIAAGLDSIAMQESILCSNKDKDGVLLSREQIMQNLRFFEELLEKQRNKIQQLQDSIKSGNGAGIEKMKTIVAFLNQQLAEKDAVIQQLKKDIGNKNRDIRELRTTMASMRTTMEKAEKKNQILNEALSVQDETINECYIKIGTKKELQRAGILKGGFLSKKKVNYSGIDKSMFTPVDIRDFREIRLRSNKPKILTPVPSGDSFALIKNGDGTCTLSIKNATKFWSLSNYLIIQL